MAGDIIEAYAIAIHTLKEWEQTRPNEHAGNNCGKIPPNEDPSGRDCNAPPSSTQSASDGASTRSTLTPLLIDQTRPHHDTRALPSQNVTAADYQDDINDDDYDRVREGLSSLEPGGVAVHTSLYISRRGKVKPPGEGGGRRERGRSRGGTVRERGDDADERVFGSVSEGRHPGMWERNKIKSGAKASTVFSRSHHDRRWALRRLWIVQNTQNHAKFLRLLFQPLHGGFF